MSGKVTIVPGSTVRPEAVLAFMRATYGAGSPQASPGFMQWTYEENPNCTEGRGHMVVAVDDQGHVVGTVDRLLITWDVRGTHHVIPTLGDLAVHPDHRKGGLGLRLVLAATKGHAHAFVNGSNPNSSPLFRGLKYQEFTGAQWHRGILHPLRGTWRMLLHRTMGRVPSAEHFLSAAFPSSTCSSTACPDDATIAELAQLLNNDPTTIKPYWTSDTVRWRFFHPAGPRHRLFHTTGTDGSLMDAMLISAGTTRGLNVCRPIAYRCSSIGVFTMLLREIQRFGARNGMDVLLAFTFSDEEATVMRRIGWSVLAAPPATFFHHARKSDAFIGPMPLIQGAASDLGLEAIARGR